MKGHKTKRLTKIDEMQTGVERAATVVTKELVFVPYKRLKACLAHLKSCSIIPVTHELDTIEKNNNKLDSFGI